MKKTFILLLAVISCMQLMAEDHAQKLRENLLHNKKYVTVISHRGDWRGAPENSLQAYQNCIDMGVDMIEIDLQKTKDNVLVIMHDGTLDRTSTGKGKISDKTYEEIKQYNLLAGDGVGTRHKIPTLEEVLNLCKGKILINIDKGYDYFKDVCELMEKTGTTSQVIIKSGHSYDKVKKENGEVLDKVIYMPIIGLNDKNAEANLDEWLAAKPVAIECCFSKYDSQVEHLLQKIRNTDTQIWINSLWPSLCDGHDDDRAVEMKDPDGAWGWILEHGATLIQCERPKALIEYLTKKKHHKLK